MEPTEIEQHSTEPSESRKIPLTTKIAVAVAAAVLLAGVGYYFYTNVYNDPQAKAKREAAAVMAAVGKLIVLPTDEQPIIATVEDPAPLKDQPFLQKASKGDKVLIYNNAKKAILYSPELNKVIDIAPFGLRSPTPAPTK